MTKGKRAKQSDGDESGEIGLGIRSPTRLETVRRSMEENSGILKQMDMKVQMDKTKMEGFDENEDSNISIPDKTIMSMLGGLVDPASLPSGNALDHAGANFEVELEARDMIKKMDVASDPRGAVPKTTPPAGLNPTQKERPPKRIDAKSDHLPTNSRDSHKRSMVFDLCGLSPELYIDVAERVMTGVYAFMRDNSAVDTVVFRGPDGSKSFYREGEGEFWEYSMAYKKAQHQIPSPCLIGETESQTISPVTTPDVVDGRGNEEWVSLLNRFKEGVTFINRYDRTRKILFRLGTNGITECLIKEVWDKTLTEKAMILKVVQRTKKGAIVLSTYKLIEP
uniref:Uncharacterized protein n=1 Tax=Hymenopteran rhabdo-related virus OKIAV8 TaxID=2746296 RepID=A0A7D7F1K5_9RHAB|nr:hypothetical protein [Hymenopteran rhabdo-related virus OKIAV8]